MVVDVTNAGKPRQSINENGSYRCEQGNQWSRESHKLEMLGAAPRLAIVQIPLQEEA